jgi:hypothetical protein
MHTVTLKKRRKMRKKIIITAVCVAALAAAFVFLSPFLIPRPVEKVLNVDFNKVDRLSIGDGATGKSCVLTDESSIRKFLGRFEGARLRKSFNQLGYSGIIYSVVLHESGKEVCRYNFGYNLITVWKGNSFVRYVSGKNIDGAGIDEIEKYYKLNS